jgi:hypothetical protein
MSIWITASTLVGTARVAHTTQANIRHGPTVASQQTDSIQIVITNTMQHPMTLSYEADGGPKPLGVVDALADRTVTLGKLHGDSVTVWATNDQPPHKFSRTFPTHSMATLTWAF